MKYPWDNYFHLVFGNDYWLFYFLVVLPLTVYVIYLIKLFWLDDKD